MANPDDLVRRYPDLIQHDSDPDLVHLVENLDRAAAAFQSAVLPDAIDETIVRHIRERAGQVTALPSAVRPPDIADDDPFPIVTAEQPLDTRTMSGGRVHRRSNWPRQWIEIAASVAILVILAGTLATVFRTMSNRPDDGPNPTQAGLARGGSGTPGTPPSIWAANPAAKALRDAGGGKTLDQAATIQGYTLTLHWAGATAQRVFLNYTVTGPKSLQFNNLAAFKPVLTTSAGITLPFGGDVGTPVNGNAEEYLDWFDASAISPTDHLALQLKVPALLVTVHVAPNGTPPAGVVVATPEPGQEQSPALTIPGDGNGLPQSYYRVGDPTASLTIRGPFVFTVTVPVEAAASGSPTSTPNATTQLTLPDAEQRVRSFLGEPTAELSGQLVDPMSPDNNNPVVDLPRPGAKLFIISRLDLSQNVDDTFIVDADTGNVLKAVMPGQISQGKDSTPTSATDPELVATQFAQTHFAGFAQLTRVTNDLLAPETNYLIGLPGQPFTSATTLLRWRQRDATTGTWLPSFVTVGVDVQSRRVVLYVARHADYHGPTTAATDRQQAIQIALTEARKDPNNLNATVASAELATVLNDGADGLAWKIELAGTVASPVWSGRLHAVQIDAATGRITGRSVAPN